MKSLKIGITGAGGMIGRYLAKNWIDENLILYSSQSAKLEHQHFLRSLDPKQDQITPFIQSSDVIIHLAHNTSPLASNRLFPESFGENISFTQRLVFGLMQQKRSKPPLVVYLSSGGTVYGDVIPVLGGITETYPTLPISPYGLEKLSCEHLLRLGAMRGHYKLVVLRASNIYGSPLAKEGSQGIIGVGLTRIKGGLPLIITMNPQTMRDYLHLENLSTAISQVIGAQLSGEFYCFNIGTGQGHSIQNIIAQFRKTTKADIKIEMRIHDFVQYAPHWNILNSDKIKGLIGWQPKISLEDGIDSLWSALFQSSSK